jgi:hypothetical protein
MELTTALVLFSAIAIFGYLANKLIDRKYGIKPNQELLDRINGIEDSLVENVPLLIDKLKERFVLSEKAIEEIKLELEKMSARIDGQQIKKAFNLDKQEVKHL